ncbi:MAG: hypothetical protein AAGA30_02670 [Planctomycetota bacterium]
MSIDIPSDYEDVLHQAVANGAYASYQEALIHALELFKAAQSEEKQKLDRWNQRNSESQEQSSQGLSTSLDRDAVVDRLQNRLSGQETRH